VIKYDGTNFTEYTTVDGLANNNVTTIFQDSNNNYWFGSNNPTSGVTKFDGTNWTIYTTADGLSNNEVRAITQDSDGNMWFGTNGGVSVFDGTSNWITYDTSNSDLPDNHVRAIIQDTNSDFWIGTWVGVSKFDPDALSVESNALNKISLYPNPTQNKLYIDDNDNLVTKISVFDVLGKKVLNKQPTDNSIDISNLKAGFYFVNLENLQGDIATYKIIKQ
jgi:ligand-binding sensor domain-containing protein